MNKKEQMETITEKIEIKESTPFIEYKTQFQEVVDYEKFVTGEGGDLMEEEYIKLGLF